MRHIFLSGFAAIFLLAGCAYDNVKTVSDTHYGQANFHEMLAAEYKKYAEFEAYEMKDWNDAEYHATKALAAAEGKNVAPSELSERSLPDFSVAEIAAARGELMDALQTLNNNENSPALAKAQASFDCWMEQQEENIQPEHIADCKVHFEQAMASLIEPTLIVEQNFEIFFAHDSAALDMGANAVVMAIKDFIGYSEVSRLLIVGNTDTTGNVAYNEKLAQKRADVVYAALKDAGVPEQRVEIISKGQFNLLVPTADNVNEPKNRRVDVVLVREGKGKK